MKIIPRVKDEIKGLMDQIRVISEDPKNLDRIQYWQPYPETARDKWRGTPKPRSALNRAPIMIEPEMTMWGSIIGFRADEFYQDPAVYLPNQLKINIFRHENFNEDTCVGKDITIWLGTTLESSLFGSKTIYTENEYPWIDREAVIQSDEDLERLEPFDFYKTGLMPLAHQFYEVIGELLDSDFKVTFPEWGRSPFGVATHVRGYENLLFDMIKNPEFVHRLMSKITDFRKTWITDRARFLGHNVEKGNLYNDEVNCPTLSIPLYDEFVLPYECELSDFHGGILYWHSCGDTTALLPSIAKIPGLEMFHVGPWTDAATAVQTFNGKVPVEICLHPVRDVQNATRTVMEKRLAGIAQACNGTPYTVRADGLQVVTNVKQDLAKIDEWNEMARRLL
jgi:uroporphyrinogen-III decarboxylase